MGVPSGPSVSWPCALISPPPAACAVVEPRAIQFSPDGEISNSSLPTSWPSSRMRNFPLSGTSPVVETAAFTSLLFFCGERRAARTAPNPAAKHKTDPRATSLLMVFRSRLIAAGAPELSHPRERVPTCQRCQAPEFARRHEWIRRCFGYCSPPAGHTEGALGTGY